MGEVEGDKGFGRKALRKEFKSAEEREKRLL